MPSLSFLFYALALGASWLFHLSYRGWFGLYLFLAMLTVPVLVLLISLPSMLSLGLKCSAPGYVTRGDQAALTLQFTSRRFLPVGSVKLVIGVCNRFALE